MTEQEKTVILEFEDKLLTCDRSVLVSNSDYFSAMLAGNFRESFQSVIQIQDVDLETFQTMLVLLRDDAHLTDDMDIYAILKCACMLQFTAIKEKCVSLLQRILNSETCLMMWKFTEMLSISPLWIQAKFLALEESYTVIEGPYIFELNLDDICSYLGHVYLNIREEFNIFQAAMNWWYENQQKYEEKDQFGVVLRLLNCIDFRQLTEFEIQEMLSFPNIVDNVQITAVLNGVLKLKYNKIIENSSISGEHLIYAKHLCNSKGRRKSKVPGLLLGQFPVPTNNSKRDILYEHVIYEESESFDEFLSIDGTKITDDLTGFHLTSYKQYICLFGGEFILGLGQWNRNFWMYDTIKGTWERKTILPVSRRHFECAVVNDCVYIVGGVGNFRIVQENIIFYDFKTDTWGSPIFLPVSDRKLKCCDFKGQLLLVSLYGNDSKSQAFFFDKSKLCWKIMCMDVDQNDIAEMGDFTLISSTDYLYVKGRLLLTFQLIKNKLVLIKRAKLNCIDYEEIKSILCNSSIYTMYKYKDEQYNLGISLEKFDLFNDKSSFIFENKGRDIGELNINNKTYFPTSMSKLFATYNYLIAQSEGTINDPIIK
ncbi:kelch-like protein 30 isoform X2 [Dendroctonus ponderosae]|uniref:kelch-like protein 30 isoform X2 n=1 Tax=Dendroctonus ponderosae TaxID=77166 RepID=UPI002034D1EA|nr:kelch-like protein 30 isoform X2 [Dendroctonus ponderosae]